MKTDAAWLARAGGGRLISPDPAAVARGEVCVDTRLLRPGDVFLALPGSRTHGARHIDRALARGADGLIAEPTHLPDRLGRTIAVAVDDPAAALNGIAKARRDDFDGPVIGVTGSVGKTTTVDILAALLPAPVRATRQGFNTHAGVAVTIAGLPAGATVLVAELSMQARGHIAAKAALLRPSAALITNIAPVHFHTAGPVAEIARNKAELISSMPRGAVCVVPARAKTLSPYLRDDLTTLRHGPGGDVRLNTYAGGMARIDTPSGPISVHTRLSQRHNLDNLVAAVALAQALGLSANTELDAQLSPLRWQTARLGELELVLDCFNSSPHALRAALEAFAAEPAGRRLVVLGPFAEMGRTTRSHHLDAGVQAGEMGIDAVIAVGDEAREYLERYPGPSYAVRSPEHARALLTRIGRPGDRVLVKGARDAGLERIAA